MNVKNILLGTSCAAVLGLVAVPVTALAAPAVSAVNGKIEIIGGTINDDGAGFLNGAVSLPVGENYGLQIDASAGTIDGDTAFGGAAHLFVRDPSEGLLGLYASYSQRDTDSDDLSIARFAVEGEYYWDRWTLSAMVGAETGDVNDDLFTLAEVSYYATDDLRLYVGHRFAQDGQVGNLGVEWQATSLGKTGVALFLEGRTGADDYDSVLAGLRFYFGEGKGLIKRHREDDPAIRILDDQFSFGDLSDSEEEEECGYYCES